MVGEWLAPSPQGEKDSGLRAFCVKFPPTVQQKCMLTGLKCVKYEFDDKKE